MSVIYQMKRLYGDKDALNAALVKYLAEGWRVDFFTFAPGGGYQMDIERKDGE